MMVGDSFCGPFLHVFHSEHMKFIRQLLLVMILKSYDIGVVPDYGIDAYLKHGGTSIYLYPFRHL